MIVNVGLKRTQLTLAQRVSSILRKYGTDAHVYLPGIGVINGLTAGNYLDSAGTTAATVDNPVGLVVDSGGINAIQGTTANKPILRRGVVNKLAQSNDLTLWDKINAVVTAGQTDPLGGTSAFKVVCTTGGNEGIYAPTPSQSEGTNSPNARSFWARADSPVDLVINNTSGGSHKVVSLTTAWQFFTDLVTTTSQGSTWFKPSSTTPVYLWHPQTEAGSVVHDYIPTTTAPASSPTGNYAWQFDGTDYLSLGSVPFQMADDHCVIAGAQLVSKAATSRVFCIASTSSNTPRVCDFNFQTTGRLRVSYFDDAGVTSELNDTTDRLSTTVIATARKSGNVRILKVNGTQVDTKTASLGATTVNTCSIGSLPILSPTTYMNGNIYPIIAIKGTVTDADLLTLEKWVGSLSGVTI